MKPSDLRDKLSTLAYACKEYWVEYVPFRYKILLPLAIVFIVLCIFFSNLLGDAWHWYKCNREAVVPLATGIGGLVALWVAFGQFKTARLRHEEQTLADRQRRITESFGKAVEQLASEKMTVRIGGIYTLERLSKESDTDYWTVMETLTAFVRDQGKWDPLASDEELLLTSSDEATKSPQLPTDIAAVLSVFRRRTKSAVGREISNRWGFDLSNSDLRGADFSMLEFHAVNFEGCRLQDADFSYARFWANFKHADLQRAKFVSAQLKFGEYTSPGSFDDANLAGADMEKAHLWSFNFRRACLRGTSLKRAEIGVFLAGDGGDFEGADLAGADVSGAKFDPNVNLSQGQVESAIGDKETQLPRDIARPTSWSAS